MSSMHLIKLPAMAICMQASRVLYRRVYVIHMLKTPKSSTHHLSQREFLNFQPPGSWARSYWEEYRHQWEPYPMVVIFTLSCMLFQVINS